LISASATPSSFDDLLFIVPLRRGRSNVIVRFARAAPGAN